MNRQKYIALMMVAGLTLGGITGVAHADEQTDLLLGKANASIAAASVAVDEVRSVIETGKQQLAQIPASSELYGEITQMTAEALKNWKIATAALVTAKENAAKISTAPSSALAKEYAVLATINSNIALSGAKVVQTSLIFIDAVANNKTEVFDIIRRAVEDSLVAATKVQTNYERMKAFIAKSK
jgi:hypothetical protein